MAAESPESVQRDVVFVSYSHEDRIWVDRLLTMLHPYLAEPRLLSVWEDRQLVPGDY